MKRMSPRQIFLLAGLLAFISTGLAGIQGQIWCIGENGHNVLEYAAGNSCMPPKGPIGHADQGARAEQCGPCLDLPASIHAASGRPQVCEDSPLPAPSIASHETPPPSIPVPDADPLAQPISRMSQTILAHRTVVLLN